MSLERWNTIGTLGTFLVIAATAIVAMIQLRTRAAALFLGYSYN